MIDALGYCCDGKLPEMLLPKCDLGRIELALLTDESKQRAKLSFGGKPPVRTRFAS
jgi:hypothetical protein